MAPTVSPKNLEKEIAQTVRDIWKTDDKAALTVNLVRERVEKKLKLEDGYLKTGEWKSKSKDIIKETVVSCQLSI